MSRRQGSADHRREYPTRLRSPLRRRPHLVEPSCRATASADRPTRSRSSALRPPRLRWCGPCAATSTSRRTARWTRTTPAACSRGTSAAASSAAVRTVPRWDSLARLGGGCRRRGTRAAWHDGRHHIGTVGRGSCSCVGVVGRAVQCEAEGQCRRPGRDREQQEERLRRPVPQVLDRQGGRQGTRAPSLSSPARRGRRDFFECHR